MLNHAIKKLKQLTIEAKTNFAECFSHFLDVTDDDEFLVEGSLMTENTDYFKTLLLPVIQFFEKDTKISSSLLVRLKKTPIGSWQPDLI